MPRFLIPRRSGVHRVACFALYRALLSQCASIPLPNEQCTELWRLVRSNFEKHKNLQSPRLVTVALQAGYKALDILDSAVNGDEASTLYISKLLPDATTAESPKGPPVPRGTGSLLEVRKKEQKVSLQKPEPFRRPAPYPGVTPILEARPRLLLPGRRRIPKLVSATGIPFLRFKKPQSPFLSRVIRDKLQQRIKYMDQRRAMEELDELAVLEDLWDKELYQTHGLPTGSMSGEMTWGVGVGLSLRYILQKVRMQDRKMIDTAQRMQKIVNGEKELARKEKLQRKLARKSRESGKTISVEDGSS